MSVKSIRYDLLSWPRGGDADSLLVASAPLPRPGSCSEHQGCIKPGREGGDAVREGEA